MILRFCSLKPHLTDEDAKQVIAGLREYFHISNQLGNQMIAMPSQVVDVAWHEFILYTKHYEDFCNKALGRFLHHTPAEAMTLPTKAQMSIKIIWKISCNRENINPRKPNKLPLLFAIDDKLNIPDGFKYSLDCKKKGNNKYCAGDIRCSSGPNGCAGGCSGGCGGG